MEVHQRQEQQDSQMKSDDSYSSGYDDSASGSYYSGDSESEYSNDSGASGSSAEYDNTGNQNHVKNERAQGEKVSPASEEVNEDRNDLVTEEEQQRIDESIIDREKDIEPEVVEMSNHSSNEESIVLKISNEEAVVVQLSNENKEENNKLEEGIEMEIVAPSQGSQHDMIESENENERKYEKDFEDDLQNRDGKEQTLLDTSEQSEMELDGIDQTLNDTTVDIPMSLSDDENYSSFKSSSSFSEKQLVEEEKEEDNDDDDVNGGEKTGDKSSYAALTSTPSPSHSYENQNLEKEKTLSPVEFQDQDEVPVTGKPMSQTERISEGNIDDLRKQVDSVTFLSSNDNNKDRVEGSVNKESSDPFDMNEASVEINPKRFFPLPKKKVIDQAISMLADSTIEREDAVLENFENLRRKKVKINTAWWIDGSDNHTGVKLEEKNATIESSLEAWFIKQFQESQNFASELDIKALNERLEVERVSKKTCPKTKVWWEVNNASRPNFTPIPHERLQWYFDSMREQENKPGLSNAGKDLDRKSNPGKPNWLTEKDRQDQTKLAGFISDPSRKRDIDMKQSIDSTNRTSLGKAETVEGDQNSDVDNENEDDSVKKEESVETRHTSITNVIDEVIKCVTIKIDGINIVHDDGEGDVIAFKDTLTFIGASQKQRTAKEILKKNSKKIKSIQVKLDTPSQKIQDLIDGAMESSISRRSNACGTIKLLAAKKKNIPMLIKSAGLIKALVFVLGEDSSNEEEDARQDAQLRALATLVMLSQPKEGRRIICQEDGLLESVANILTKRKGEFCLNACSIIAALAKTEENREIIMSKKGLLRKLSAVLRSSDEKDDNNMKKTDEMSKECDDDDDDDTDDDTSNPKDSNITPDKQINAIILNACAALLHLSKSCAVTAKMCADHNIIENIALVSQNTSNSVHTKCIEIICNLTRFPGNAVPLSRSVQVLDALSTCGSSSIDEDRLWTMRSLQNMTADPICKSRLATASIIDLLCVSAVNLEHKDEHEAAISALANFCTDASAIVQVSNSNKVIPTLIHIAHNGDYSAEVQFHACNAISRIAVWFQTFAGMTTVPDSSQVAPLPTMEVKGNMRWDFDE